MIAAALSVAGLFDAHAAAAAYGFAGASVLLAAGIVVAVFAVLTGAIRP